MAIQHASEIAPVVEYIHEKLDDSLTLEKLARHAGYSPYHFAHLFKAHMGLPPLYFIAALRLQRAKHLLLHTDFTIRDIALEVGQQSLGTFTTRFRERVGVTPAVFRRSAPHAIDPLPALQKLAHPTSDNPSGLSQPAASPHCTIGGTIGTSVPFEGVALVGLFPRPIPEGIPQYGTLVSPPATFCLSGVKPGTYYLMATAVAWNMSSEGILLTQKTLRTRYHSPIQVHPRRSFYPLEVTLYPPRLDDPPILISLPLWMNRFLQEKKQDRNP